MPRPRVQIDDAELARRYADGETMEALALAYGVSTTTIHRHLRAAGVEARHTGWRPQPSKDPGAERLRELHLEQGLTACEIARALGMTVRIAAKWLHRAGIARDRGAARRASLRRQRAE